MSGTKKLLKNSGIYGIVSMLQKCIGFLLLPLYTSYLTTNDYGIIAVVTSIISFLSILYTLSLNASINRYYFEYKDDEEKLKEFWGTNILFILLNSLMITIVLILFRKFLLQPLAKDIPFFPYILLGLISITLNPIYSIHQSILQTQQQAKKYGITNLTYFILNILLTIFFVVILKIGAVGVLAATSITDGMFFTYTVFTFLPKLTFKINRNYLKKSLKYSIPLIPHSLAGWTMSMIDRIFLNGMKSTASVGIYNIGFQFGNILNMLTTAVNQAYVPWFYEKMANKQKNEKEILNFAEIAIFAYGFIAMVMSLLGPEIMRIMTTSKFREGWKAIPFIAFAYVFNGIYYFFVNPLFYNSKGTKFVPIGTFTAAILNMLLNLLMIPKYGFIGASLASLLANLIASILIFFISYKIERLKFNLVKIYTITFIFLSISISVFWMENFSFGIKIFMKMVIIFLFLIAILVKYRDKIYEIKSIFK